MRTLENTADVDSKTESVFAAYEPIKIPAIFASSMPVFFAILGVLLCLFETRANELPVIKDSKAVHNIGKNVEVRGFVVSVRTSPLGTTLINFGRDYPDQTFAGSNSPTLRQP